MDSFRLYILTAAMAIEFPCLKTDLSQWFADAEGTKRSEEQQLLESLKMFLISEEAQRYVFVS